MPNICTFSIEINGDPRRVQALKELIVRGIEKIPDAKFERYVLMVDRLHHDLQDAEHKFIWLDDGKLCPNDGQFIKDQGPFWFSADHSRMLLHGTSRHALPGPLVERLSSAFPDLAFTYGGTTEHTLSESWSCKGGVSKCEWSVERDIQAEKEMWYVRNGQPVRAPEWIDMTSRRVPRAGGEDESRR